MRRYRSWALLVFIAASGAARVEAQTTVVSSTSSEIAVEARITTTETVTVTSGPAAVGGSSESGPALRVLLHPRAEFHLGDETDYDFAAWGASVLIGADVGAGWSGGLTVGYLSDIGSGASELNLGLEVARDFAPESALGFRVLGRIGPAFMLGGADQDASRDDYYSAVRRARYEDAPRDSGIRLVAQLAIGMRLSFDPNVAFTLDLGGATRYSPDHSTLSSGMVITTGVALLLD